MKQPAIVVLYCQQAVPRAGGLAARAEKVEGFSLRTVMMPCSSKVQAYQLLQILDDGADGVEVVACPDAACRFLVGSRRAEKRVEYARGLLDDVGVGGDRLGITRKSGVGTDELLSLARARARAVQQLRTEGDEP